MESTTKYLHELHAEHREFNAQLDFVIDELNTYKHRLEEVAVANSKLEVMQQVEHFQNQFIRHKEVIDELKSMIHHYEKSIADLAEANNVATDHRKTEDHTELREQMATFTKIYTDLKSDFLGFLSKTL
jgi:uncharacterized coiled-coil DUF342 family protein